MTLQHAVLLAGLGYMKPNTLLLDWFSRMTGMSPTEYITIVKVILQHASSNCQDVQLTDMHIILSRNFENLDTDRISAFYHRSMPLDTSVINTQAHKKMFVDVWALPVCKWAPFIHFFSN